MGNDFNDEDKKGSMGILLSLVGTRAPSNDGLISTGLVRKV